ncbi:MAG: LPS export ABC transporter permease LptF [Tatlockia sp.]|nr:LPS export ABC transporter permease LptF [Tatlockia sp.]
MLIFRYLAKEVFFTLVALTIILMLIFLSNQFVGYLNRAAGGQFSSMIIMKLMMFEIPNLLVLLLPLGFYVALLIAYGRLYAESEMTVLHACGYSPSQLLKSSLVMATIVFIVVSIIMIWLSPIINTERTQLLKTSASGVKNLIQLIQPGRFQADGRGGKIFYVESMNRDHSRAKNVFLAHLNINKSQPSWDIVWAEKAFTESDPKTSEEYLIMQKGQVYQGFPGFANYQVAEFDQYNLRIPHQKIAAVHNDLRTATLASLLPFNNPDKAKAAELQWRLSVPIMVFVLTLVAVPLSRVNPRLGKYAKLLPAIVIYIIYANFIFVSRDWMISGKIPWWIGVWWLHLTIALLGGLLIWRNRVKLS